MESIRGALCVLGSPEKAPKTEVSKKGSRRTKNARRGLGEHRVVGDKDGSPNNPYRVIYRETHIDYRVIIIGHKWDYNPYK